MAIVGIPDSGKYLAGAINTIAPLFGIETTLHASRSDGRVPGSWTNVVAFQSPESFTTEAQDVDFAIQGLLGQAEDVLVVDDFCARGETAITSIQALLKNGLNVSGFITLVEKAFQGGIEVVHDKYGVSCAAILSIDEISPSGISRMKSQIQIKT